jgi:choline-sulfatase
MVLYRSSSTITTVKSANILTPLVESLTLLIILMLLESKVPFIWAGKGIAQNEKVKTPVSLIDIYPTLIELCGLSPNRQLEGVSLILAIQTPSSAVERDIFVPYHKRGGYAVVNSNWRYIYYPDGTEALYNVKEDSNEWYNLSGKEEYRDIIEEMKKAAPKTFSPAATPRNKLKLIIEGDTFHWEPR